MSASDLILLDQDGERSLYVGPALSENLPSAILATGAGCPCGARLVIPNRAARRKAMRAGCGLEVPVEHEPDCPAVAPALECYLAGGRR